MISNFGSFTLKCLVIHMCFYCSRGNQAAASSLEGVTEARNLAAELEEAFLKGALDGWEQTGAMMEKYDAQEAGKGGGGGEYDLQVCKAWMCVCVCLRVRFQVITPPQNLHRPLL